MKILLACEESQAVCTEFRKKGHDAFSCDIQDCTGGHPEWHIKDDILNVIGGGGYDMLIGFPPCTYISGAGNGYFNILKYGDKAIERWEKRIEGVKFFMALWNSGIPKIALENPLGFLNGTFPPSQIIEPYYFGDSDKKRTCLWLKNLPPLIHHKEHNLFGSKTHVDKPEPVYIDVSGKKRYFTEAISGGTKESSINRSKTFTGIAKAMAEQWG